jgi:nickel-dependent lactate racemase
MESGSVRSNRQGWRVVAVEHGPRSLDLWVPERCEILSMKPMAALQNPREHIERALSHPAGSPSLEDLIASQGKPAASLSAVVAVSDNTRPVPYRGEREDGILLPLLLRLENAGVRRDNVRIIVATGTHRATSGAWKRKAFGEPIMGRYRVSDHDCTSADLRPLGTFGGVDVGINSSFYEADIRIVTGLVEPHFMAGYSGGRKVVCPGLVNLEATNLFHGADVMDHARATNLVLEGNPCHDMALEVARKLGVHFSVNAALNRDMELSGVWAGDLERAHEEAVGHVRKYAALLTGHEYDLVLTHGGRVAVNHYQAVKAAYATIPIVKAGGVVILVAHNGDTEPVGKDEYKRVMGVLAEKGPGAFTDFIKSGAWRFTPDQWQVQKWDQFFKKVGSFDGLIYCTSGIGPEELEALPGRSGYDFAPPGSRDITTMVQGAIDESVAGLRKRVGTFRMAYVREGPYAVPLTGEER